MSNITPHDWPESRKMMTNISVLRDNIDESFEVVSRCEMF
jgi:hypothetical protein